MINEQGNSSTELYALLLWSWCTPSLDGIAQVAQA